MLNVEKIQKDFSILKSGIIYLDSAARRKFNKTQTFRCSTGITQNFSTTHKNLKEGPCFEGREKLRFEDVVTAVASLFLVTVLISYPMEIVLSSTLGLHLGPPIGASVAVLFGGLIIGHIFSGRTMNGRKESIAKISVLFTVVMVFSIVLNNAVLGQDFTNWFHETYQESNSTASLTTFEWFLVGGLFVGSQMFMNTIVLFLFSFIGLFTGSLLKKTTK